MNIDTQITVAFLAAFVSGVIGAEVGYRHKGIQRAHLVRATLALLIGFMSAIVALLIMTRGWLHPLAVAMPVGLATGYLMVGAKAFRRLQ